MTAGTQGHAVPVAATVPGRPSHPAWVRLCHWFNAASCLVLMASGWRIYNASPLWSWRFPREWTLGGWLGGALQWHFAAMWLLAASLTVYAVGNLLTWRWRERWWPDRVADVPRDIGLAMRGRLPHDRDGHYNAVQRLAYGLVLVDLCLLLISGLVLWKSVQFPALRELLGGYGAARRVHFVAMAVLVAFVGVHLVMVAIVPRTLLVMLRGRT